MQYDDPVESLPDPKFYEFFEWVEREMESAGVFDLNHHIAEIKAKVGWGNCKHPQYIALLSSLVGSPQVSYRWLIKWLFGSRLPKTLARNWMSKLN
jgi:hypothetical protein